MERHTEPESRRTTERDTNPAAEASLDVYDRSPVVREEHAEASFTRVIEQQTAKVPSHWFLLAAFAAMGATAALELAGRRRLSRFVSLWPSTLLVAGVYNKLVKSLEPR